MLDAAPDNEEKPKTADVVVDVVGPGSVDCLALHKKGLYVAGQVRCFIRVSSMLITKEKHYQSHHS